VALEASRARLVDVARDARIEVADLTAEQQKIDADVEQVKARRARDQQRMDAGSVSPRDLERIQHELVSLQRRISSLEDDELEVMGRLEEAQGRLDHVEQELEGTERRAAELRESRDATWAEIDGQTSDVAGTRAWAAEDVPADLLKVYDRVRAQRGGIGAALLRQRQCTGCRLGIDNLELARIAALPPDEVVRCEECTRILVRTDESGL
jgi:predicted  nucleic acid-binding Zn-ribbon protein